MDIPTTSELACALGECQISDGHQRKLTMVQRKWKEALMVAEIEDKDRVSFVSEKDLLSFRTALSGGWKIKSHTDLHDFLRTSKLDPLENVLFQAAHRHFDFTNELRSYEKLNSFKLNDMKIGFGEDVKFYGDFANLAWFAMVDGALQLKLVYVHQEKSIFKTEELVFTKSNTLQLTTILHGLTKTTRTFEKLTNPETPLVKKLLGELELSNSRANRYQLRLRNLSLELRPFLPMDRSFSGTWHSLRPLRPHQLVISVNEHTLSVATWDTPTEHMRFGVREEDPANNLIYLTLRHHDRIVTKNFNRSTGKEVNEWVRFIGGDGKLVMKLVENGRVKMMKEYEKVSEIVN